MISHQDLYSNEHVIHYRSKLLEYIINFIRINVIIFAFLTIVLMSQRLYDNISFILCFGISIGIVLGSSIVFKFI
jgi:hypothetical protein